MGGEPTMRILVTGAAGFIGSHLCEQLLMNEKVSVVGVDGHIDSSLCKVKERNVRNLLKHPRFTLLKQDLLTIDLEPLVDQVDVIYHLAGIPGVRSSWGTDFKKYVTHNIVATQQLLEACRRHSLEKFIYISTSSVYGQKNGKVGEKAPPTPLSPYGVSKLTGEHLCNVYYRNFSIPTVILRYFTVYGPRQRQDMAFHRFIKAIIDNQPIPIFGDGNQSRDFTYIDDCIAATCAVLHADVIGETINIGGKERATVLQIISMLESIFQKDAKLQFLEKPFGEPMSTWADISKAEKLLRYSPNVPLLQGIEKEVDDLLDLYQID